MNDKMFYRIVKRMKDGSLVSPFTPERWSVQFIPGKRTSPLIGKLFVYYDKSEAWDVMDRSSVEDLELWKCTVGNPIEWNSVERISLNFEKSIKDYWEGKSRRVSILYDYVFACDWIELAVLIDIKEKEVPYECYKDDKTEDD